MAVEHPVTRKWLASLSQPHVLDLERVSFAPGAGDVERGPQAQVTWSVGTARALCSAHRVTCS
jgi:hypothetical protein